MCPSGGAVHTRPGSASTTRLSSLSILVLPDGRRYVKVRHSACNVHHTLVSICGGCQHHLFRCRQQLLRGTKVSPIPLCTRLRRTLVACSPPASHKAPNPVPEEGSI